MKFFIVFLGFLVIACKSGQIDKHDKKLKCEEHDGVCPVFPKNCEEFHHSKISCLCDDLCEPHQKCCDHPCYAEKICVSAHKKPEEHTRRTPKELIIITADLLKTHVKPTHRKINSNAHLMNPADLFKKTTKQSLHFENSDKHITNPALFHKHSVQDHKEYKPSPEMKINVIYNIVKKIYVQNMNIYKDRVEVGDKKVETITEPTKVESSIDFNSQSPILTTPAPGLEDDEDFHPESGSGSGPVITVENKKTPEGSTAFLNGSKYDLNTSILTTPIPGLEDDEDNFLGNGSGSGPIPDENTKSPERSAVEDLDGSGDIEIDNLEEIIKILKTTDGKEVIVLNDNNHDFDPDITFDD